MQQKLIWLKVSLFTKKWNWHYLLQEVELFFSKNSLHIVDYLIEFNFLSGENIRLSIHILESSVTEFVPLMDRHFKLFFVERNLTTKNTLLPVNGIFKPFEQNTIQYGLFDISYRTGTDEARLGARLSRVILTALKDDEIDDETIITIAFYLHAAILKVIKDRSQTAHEIENYYINSVSLTGSDISIEFLIDKFSSNSQDLIDIYQNIMVENQLNLPHWMEDWIASINNEFENNNVNLTGTLQIEKYHKIISIVNQHLGLSHNSWILVSYFLQQTINAC